MTSSKPKTRSPLTSLEKTIMRYVKDNGPKTEKELEGFVEGLPSSFPCQVAVTIEGTDEAIAEFSKKMSKIKGLKIKSVERFVKN
jgi:acylphosphatase